MILNRLPIFLILALAFTLRVLGVNFGLPDLYHADEPIVVNHALAFGSGDFNPHFFKIPPLVSYLLFSIYGLFFLLGKTAGLFGSVQDFELLFYANPTAFYLLARLIFGVLLGTLSVYVFYRFLLKTDSLERALVGALLLSVCLLHVRQSHYVYADIPLVLVMILAYFPLMKTAHGEARLRDHVVMGFYLGLATAIKYNGGVLIIPYFFALGWPSKKKLFYSCFLTLGAAFITFVLLNPYAFLDFKFFVQEIYHESEAHRGGVPWFYHATYSLANAMGWPLFLVSLFGLGKALFHKDKARQTFAFFAISYYVVLCRWGQPYPRYVLPLLPVLFLFASDVLVNFFGAAIGKKRFWIFLVTLLLALPTFLHAVLFDRVMLAPDNRTLAKTWIEENIATGSKIALEQDFYMPRLRFSPAQLEEKKFKLGAESFHAQAKMRKLNFLLSEALKRPSYELYELSHDVQVKENFILAMPKLPYELQALRAARIDYVITVRVWETDLHQEFYEILEKQAKLVAEFNPYRGAKRLWPYTHPLTGGPFLFRDLWERARNGQPLKIYKI